MKNILNILCLTIFLCSCRTENSDNQAISKEIDSAQSVSIIKPKQFKKSLPTKQILISEIANNYPSSDSLYEFDTYKIYAGQINDFQIRLYQNTDSTTIVYQKNKKKWVRTDKLNYPIAYVKQTDLNGDGQVDLVVTHYVTGSGGNSENFSLIFNPLEKQFRHNEFFDLPNIKYDKKRKLILSSWWSGGSRPQEKMTYKITGDSLAFNEGVTFEPDEKTNGKYAKVEIYNLKQNKRIILKTIKGNSEKMFATFTKYLWDTSGE